MLVDYGCQKADEQGVIAVLGASDMGKGLYLKHGFRVIKEQEFDFRPFGFDSIETKRSMLRMPLRRVREFGKDDVCAFQHAGSDEATCISAGWDIHCVAGGHSMCTALILLQGISSTSSKPHLHHATEPVISSLRNRNAEVANRHEALRLIVSVEEETHQSYARYMKILPNSAYSLHQLPIIPTETIKAHSLHSCTAGLFLGESNQCSARTFALLTRMPVRDQICEIDEWVFLMLFWDD